MNPAILASVSGLSPAFNGSLANPDIYEVRRYVEDATTGSALKIALIGVDFFMFNRSRGLSENFQESRLSVDPSGRKNWLYLLPDLVSTLLTTDAALESLKLYWRKDQIDLSWLPQSLRFLKEKKGVSWFSNGFRFQYLREKYVARETNIVKEFRDTIRSYILGRNSYRDYKKIGTTSQKQFQDFRLMLSNSISSGVEVIVFVPPSHAMQGEAIQAAGLWNEFEDWKRNLVKFAEEVGRDKGVSIPVWDFSDYSPISTENILPAAKDWRVVEGWWDSSHFRPSIGDIVLKRIFERPGNSFGLGELVFGNSLNSRNIEEHLRIVRERRVTWRQNNSEQANWVDAVTKEALKELSLEKKQ